MKELVLLFLALAFVVPAFAAGQGNVLYVGGSVASLKDGTAGKLDTSSETQLTFVSSSGRLSIPFAMIDSYEHSEAVAHHLGVLPAIAVSLVKKRQKKHFLRIAYRDQNKTPQVAIFEVPKKMPMALLAILQERAPQGCKAPAYARCRAVAE